MRNYNIYVNTENEKYTILGIIRDSGATVDGVSGCGTGYYIQLSATDNQADKINAKISEVL